MQREIVILPPRYMVGLKTHTSYEQELTPFTSKIAQLTGKYFQEGWPQHIPHRVKPGVVMVAYTNYEGDSKSAYTYHIGEEVSAISTVDEKLHPVILEGGTYVKLSSDPGPMPFIIMSTWQKIWTMKPEELGGHRLYQTDFEIYDERALNPLQTVFDIYLGIKPL
jgi:predicted transcriptional regulator YdeE